MNSSSDSFEELSSDDYWNALAIILKTRTGIRPKTWKTIFSKYRQ